MGNWRLIGRWHIHYDDANAFVHLNESFREPVGWRTVKADQTLVIGIFFYRNTYQPKNFSRDFKMHMVGD